MPSSLTEVECRQGSKIEGYWNNKNKRQAICQTYESLCKKETLYKNV